MITDIRDIVIISTVLSLTVVAFVVMYIVFGIDMYIGKATTDPPSEPKTHFEVPE